LLSVHGARAATLEEILTTCRVISLHAASLPATRHLLDGKRLRLIPDGAVLINTARGALIDTDALVAELKTGRFTAALDVFDPDEPLPPEHPLRDLPNVILTPHIAGPVRGRYWEMGRHCVENVALALSGETPSGAITAEQIDWIA
jgi:phosphoglycerate dehydrogenase-like enzyme